ncbi:MAG: endo-1,4-beta-xylanase [Chitinophagaceae bacterium]|nr:endo-1,4-beta-xylanase [Chitinophagaceae bacterium]
MIFHQRKHTLRDAADFPIGAAVSGTPFLNDAGYSGVVKRDFDGVTFEWLMKHGAIVEDNGTLNFANTDALVNAVGSQEIFGHTLAWHENVNSVYLKNFAGITIPDAAEMLLNGNFEAGGGALTNWNPFNLQNSSTWGPTTTASEVHTGTRAMRVQANVGDPTGQWKVQIASDLVDTEVGKQYRISYYAKAASGTGSIRLSTATAGGGSAQYQGDQAIPSGTWTQIIWTITANSPQTRVVIDMGAQVNTYFLDEFSMKEVVTAPSGPAIAAKLEEALEDFITTTVSRYKGKVRAWDVLNEPMSPGGDYRTSQNSTDISGIATRENFLMWSDYMGRDYALKAFQFAAAADPTADLYINDFGLESSAAKTDSLIALVTELKAKGAKIDGIGTQMHLARSNINYGGIDRMMQKLAATGLKVRISELDVRVVQSNASGGMTPEFAGYQAAIYKYAIESYMKHVPVAQRAGITIWGVNDANSWLYNGGAEFPLLYDNSYNKKPAYAAVLQALQGK